MIYNFKIHPNYNLVRLVACFLVVLHHAIAYFEIKKELFFPVLKLFSSTCVPLFILLSGALLLPKNENYKVFFRKRIKNISIPFIFWILFYTLFRLSTSFLNNTDNIVFILKNLIGINGWPFYHLWYIYLIIYIYILTPLLRKTINFFGENYKLIVSFILFFVVQLISFLYDNIFWSNYIAFYLMGGIISQLLSNKKYYFLLVLVMSIVVFLGIYQNLDFILVPSLAVLIFLILIGVSFQMKWIEFIIPLTLGIYLLHPLVLKIISKFSVLNNNIYVLTLFVFLLTTSCVYIAKKNKLLTKVF